MNMQGGEHHDVSDVEEQVPMEEGGEHDVERVKRAFRKLHTN